MLSPEAVAAAIVALSFAAPIGAPDVDVPACPGLYAVHAIPDVWHELGLGAPGAEPFVLYVGKSESSLVTRDVGTHFSSGRTGSSTLRRSLAALLASALELHARPRNPAKPERFANFGLEPDSDARLTRWMHERLTLATWPAPDGMIVGEAERAVLARLVPPLNLKEVDSRWRAHIKAARRKMALEAEDWSPA